MPAAAVASKSMPLMRLVLAVEQAADRLAAS
jgi:hypothetical protein